MMNHAFLKANGEIKIQLLYLKCVFRGYLIWYGLFLKILLFSVKKKKKNFPLISKRQPCSSGKSTRIGMIACILFATSSTLHYVLWEFFNQSVTCDAILVNLNSKFSHLIKTDFNVKKALFNRFIIILSYHFLFFL